MELYKSFKNNEGEKLDIYYEKNPENPRRIEENIDTMIIFHSSYALGDEHNYSDSMDFFIDLAEDIVSESTLIEKTAKYFKDYKVITKDGLWYISNDDDYTYRNKEYAEYELMIMKDNYQDVWIEQWASAEELLEIINEQIYMLPIYMYDHSGITIRTFPFSCKYDSGQVGWIYLTKEQAKIELGIITKEKAFEYLKEKVKYYNSYLTGEVFGYICTDQGKETDSCWGFVGDNFKDNGLISNLSKEYKDLLRKTSKAI